MTRPILPFKDAIYSADVKRICGLALQMKKAVQGSSNSLNVWAQNCIGPLSEEEKKTSQPFSEPKIAEKQCRNTINVDIWIILILEIGKIVFLLFLPANFCYQTQRSLMVFSAWDV